MATSTEPTAPAAILTLCDLMMQWVRGERSHWNDFAGMDGDHATVRAMCAVADAQEVVKLSAAIQALAAVSDVT